MKWIVFLILLVGISVQAKPVKVVVIDTGLKTEYLNKANLCLSGHRSFADGTLNDTLGHGTNVVGLINKYAKNTDYCIVILKYTNSSKNPKNAQNFIRALEYTKTLKPDIINLSTYGPGYIQKERQLILDFLNKDVTIVASAGNGGSNLDLNCNSYPACYDRRIWTIGALGVSKTNTGSIVDAFFPGNLQTAFGITLSGTSQATAIFTGKMIQHLKKDRK